MPHSKANEQVRRNGRSRKPVHNRHLDEHNVDGGRSAKSRGGKGRSRSDCVGKASKAAKDGVKLSKLKGAATNAKSRSTGGNRKRIPGKDGGGSSGGKSESKLEADETRIRDGSGSAKDSKG